MKILVPTDFSDNAMKAALYAAEIAKRSEADIFLVHAMELGHEKIYAPFSLHEKYNNLVWDDRKKELDVFRNSVVSVYDSIKVDTEILDGDTVESILAYAGKIKAGLIVLGTKGAGKIKERLVGTVAAGVAGRSEIPVLVVPEQYEIEEPDGILFATDHFEKSGKILDPLFSLARLFSASLYAVVFVDTEKAKTIDYLEQQRNMEQYIAFLRKEYPDISITGEMIEGREFENAVELFRVRHNADISAMVTYPKGVWEKLLHKSATKKMVYHSHTPVLVIPGG